MARKKFQDEPENHDRWLVSYADFVTLLFAFFVVMYAISSVNEGKYRILTSSLISAFGKVGLPPLPTTIIENTANTPEPIRPITSQRKRNGEATLRREKEQMTNMARDILKTLDPLIAQGKVRVTQSSRGVSIEINASVLFDPGEAKLTSESSQALYAVATILKNDHHAIQVEGHTDNLPISNVLFPSNWELSAVRASSVVRLFVDRGIPETRLLAVGHGAKQPVSTNDTPEGRLRNRRVEIMILSALSEKVTEVPVLPHAITNPEAIRK